MNEGLRLLVVDDEASTLKLLEYVLSKAGYEVHCATNGREGLIAAEQVLPHLIVADVIMPEMDGLEMCRRIRRLPGFEVIPFVFLSARSQISDRVEGLETGADDYIAKPFDRNELLARIEAVRRRAEAYERVTRIDSLTDLGNREFFEQRLKEELYREQRYGVSSTLALVAIDIDELARIRAEHGSAGGDQVVRHVGRFLKDNVRALDVPARFTESGFIVLMPHTSRDRAMIAIGRLSARLNGEQVHLPEGELPVSTSFGVAVVEGELNDLHDLLNRAQESMMLARRQGTGEPVVWTSDVAVTADEAQDADDSDR